MIEGLKPYPEYRESGITGLGMVPMPWPCGRLKRICALRYGDALAAEQRMPGPIEVYGSNGRVGYHSAANTTAPCIIVGRKGSFGKVNFTANSIFVIDTAFYIDSSCTKANLKWLSYALSVLGLDQSSRDSAIPGLDRNEAYAKALAWPPSIDEQHAIVRFLDYADHRIRRYIAAKRKLIALLEEQKQAIIHQAVTRGLDPNVRMRDSGVAWLSSIPAHWREARIKSIANIRYGLGQPPPEKANGIPFVRATNVDSGRILSKGMMRIDPSGVPPGRGATLSQGEIIVVRSGAYTADSAIVPPEYDGAVAGYDMVVSARNVEPAFLAQCLLSPFLRDEQLVPVSVRSAQPHLNAEELGRALIVVPPLSEQHAIVRFLDYADRRIHRSIALAQREISLLREYRTRLISDVVTGKLDVRDAAAKLPNEVDSVPDAELVDDADDSDDPTGDTPESLGESA